MEGLNEGLTAREWEILKTPLSKLCGNAEAWQTVFSVDEKHQRWIAEENRIYVRGHHKKTFLEEGKNYGR